MRVEKDSIIVDLVDVLLVRSGGQVGVIRKSRCGEFAKALVRGRLRLRHVDLVVIVVRDVRHDVRLIQVRRRYGRGCEGQGDEAKISQRPSD
jgi:hypothetical protein